jgi:predicted AAA+ superfamily ATPase
MYRDIEQDLLKWKKTESRMPLLVRGARQVGKSYVVEQFGNNHFSMGVVTINFELQPELKGCFDDLEPKEIINRLTLLTRQKIEASSTLLFLDEIQDCPQAIRALRYFKEKMPELHVIGAGSLLEFTLNDLDFRMPVGRVQSLYLKPLSFKEYLSALGFQDLRDYLENCTLQTVIPDVIHQRLLNLMQKYCILGGMPAVIQDYLQREDLLECQQIQTALLSTYRRDFGKYAKLTDHKYLQRLFERIPALVTEDFKYTKVDPDMRSRDIKRALEMLRYAGLVYPVYSTAASGIPLISLMNEKKFKVIFLDVGLVMRATRVDAELLLSQDVFLLNRGALAEQFVGQELLAYSSRFDEENLYYWCREQKSSQAQVDYVIMLGDKIVPVEVKAGMSTQLKSLHLFMHEKQSELGIHISQRTLAFKNKVLSLPLYLIGELSRMMV